MRSDSILFYPRINRSAEYPKKPNGEFFHYQYYRQVIRNDCLYRCVYCDIQEQECGGEELMELEHFRPRQHFASLANDPNNLVYSCSGCNRLKSDHWPEIIDDTNKLMNEIGEGFVDPFLIDRNDFFRVLDDGEIVDVQPPAKYMILILALNRESRRKIRGIRLEKVTVINTLDQKILSFQDYLKQNTFQEGQKEYLYNLLASLISLRESFIRCLFIDI